MSDKMKEMLEIAWSISSVQDVDSLLNRISTTVEKYVSAEESTIMLLDDDQGTLSFKIVTGEKGHAVQKIKIRLGQGIAGTVAQTMKPIIINDTAHDTRFNAQIDQTSGIATRSLICVPMTADGELIGIIEVLNKKDGTGFTDDDRCVAEALAAVAAVSINNARVVSDQRNFFVNMIELMVSAIESRDPKLSGHAWKVARTAARIGKGIRIEGQEYKNIYYAALLHDIGILGVRDTVCMSDGIIVGKDQNPETTHPRIGAEMIKNINLLKGAVPYIRHHHENYDGTGFPDALTGDQIPRGARVLAVAEAIEEMRAAGIGEDRIRQMLERGAHTRFDPAVVEAFNKEPLS
jgi:HD-GYP domain-containing protein (c-di-GMP phosphodiesterase class II)